MNRRNKKICGAKAKSTGKPCKKPPMKGKTRCDRHGGKSTGAPKGNDNALKHGIYAVAYTEDEKADLPRLRETLGALEEELLLTKTRLKRAVDLERKIEHGDDRAGLELSTVRRTSRPVTVQTENGVVQSQQHEDLVERKRPDYRAIIDRLVGRIAHLEQVRTELKFKEIEALRDRLTTALERVGGEDG